MSILGGYVTKNPQWMELCSGESDFRIKDTPPHLTHSLICILN